MIYMIYDLSYDINNNMPHIPIKMFPEPEIVTQTQQEELPVEVPVANKNPSDDSTDIKMGLADNEITETTNLLSINKGIFNAIFRFFDIGPSPVKSLHFNR